MIDTILNTLAWLILVFGGVILVVAFVESDPYTGSSQAGYTILTAAWLLALGRVLGFRFFD
jgi:hypothetical protein